MVNNLLYHFVSEWCQIKKKRKKKTQQPTGYVEQGGAGDAYSFMDRNANENLPLK